MKKVISAITILMLCLNLSALHAGKYESAMIHAIEKLYSSKTLEDYVKVASAFERIGAAESKEWLPYYYAGLGYIWTSHTTEDKALIDGYLDKAQELVNAAEKLSPNNDEIVTLQGYIYMMKVVVDPQTRGPEYSGMALQEFGRAVGMNENNPRALLLKGRMQMGTDQFFGNDLTASCEIITKASGMFDSVKQKSKLAPSWGKEMSLMFVKECQSK